VRLRIDGTVRPVPLEDYVAGCVLAELGSPRADVASTRRARQVQAILCRSFAVASRGRHGAEGFDLCATTHCQVYRPVPETAAGRLAREAAADTRGIVLVFDGRSVRPLYHADCGGHTSPAESVWPGPGEPWLVPVEDETCARGAGWTFEVEVERLGQALAGTLPGFRAPLRDVEVASTDVAGRAATLRVIGATVMVVRGDEFRGAVMRAFGAPSLPSTMFSIRRSESRLRFDGRGAGHGVGLCQAGALRLATLGQTPEAILQRYFPGTRLSRID
jgi:stage II sporulation protein D